MKNLKLLLILLVIVSLVLQGVNIFLSNKIAANSIHAAQLSEKINKLDEKNRILSTQVLELSSLEKIASRAATLGLVEKQKYISLFKPLEVAVR